MSTLEEYLLVDRLSACVPIPSPKPIRIIHLLFLAVAVQFIGVAFLLVRLLGSLWLGLAVLLQRLYVQMVVFGLSVFWLQALILFGLHRFLTPGLSRLLRLVQL